MRGLSLVVASGGHSSSQCAGLSLSRPLVAGHRLQTRRLSNYGSRAQPLRGMCDLPRPGLEPVSPALAGGFSTTVPPGKPQYCFFIYSDNTCLLIGIFRSYTSNTILNKSFNRGHACLVSDLSRRASSFFPPTPFQDLSSPARD